MCSTESSMASLLGGKDSAGPTHIERSQQRLVDLTTAVSRAEQHDVVHSEISGEGGKYRNKGDWTGTYRYWSEWEDVEELQSQASEEKDRLEALVEDNMNPMGHCHSHTEERKMFELPEEEKMAFCERHRHLGNLLYGEGILPKAAEQYKLALSYYDYCFPDDNEEQLRLDEVRHAAQCNISLCYRQMGFLGEALEMASQAVRDCRDKRKHFSDEVIGKAYYRRAQAYRQLDEYDLAEADLLEAGKLVSDKTAIAREKQLVQAMKKKYLEKSREMAKNMISISNGKETLHANRADREHHSKQQQNIHRKASDITPPLSCLNLSIPLEPKWK